MMIVTSNTDKEIEDPVERMLKRTGCIELHYQVQVRLFYGCIQTGYAKVDWFDLLTHFQRERTEECIAEHQDWRKCQGEVKRFKECMAEHTKRQESRG